MKLGLSKFDKILAGIIAGLMIIIMLVTVITLATNSAHPGKNLRDADPEPEPQGATFTTESGNFSIASKHCIHMSRF